MSKRPAIILALLALGLLAYRLGNRVPERETRQVAAVTPAGKNTKRERRGDDGSSLDGGASLKIESALEKSSTAEALEGFRELVEAADRNRAELIALIREIGTADYQQDPRFLKLEDRSRDFNGRINVARAALGEHGVDHEVVDAIMVDTAQRVERSRAILELKMEQLKKQSDGLR
jgi:hypothetical protein